MSAAGLRIVAKAIRAVRERDELRAELNEARGHAEALSAEIEVWRALAEDSGRAEEMLCAEVDRLRAELAEEREASSAAQDAVRRERTWRAGESAWAKTLIDQLLEARQTTDRLRAELAEAHAAIEVAAETAAREVTAHLDQVVDHYRGRAETAEREAARLRAELCARSGRSHMDWEARS